MCGDLIIIIIIIIVLVAGTRLMTIVDARTMVVACAAANTGRCHCGGRCPTDHHRRRRGHEQPEPAGVKARPVAVHQDHCGGEVERTCGQDSVRGSAVEGLAGHQSRGVVVVAFVVRLCCGRSSGKKDSGGEQFIRGDNECFDKHAMRMNTIKGTHTE